MSAIPFDTTALFIAGRWQGAAGGGTLPLTNPSDGSSLAQIARGQETDVDAAVAAAQAALQDDWGALTAAERGRLLLKLSGLVLKGACSNGKKSGTGTETSSYADDCYKYSG